MSKTLVCTQNFLPYMKGDVFTVTDEEWDAITNETVVKGRDLKINPLIRNCVEEYKPNKEEHVALLEAQRGKPVDADTERTEQNLAAAEYQRKADNKVAEAEKARDEAVKAKEEAEKALAEATAKDSKNK